MTFLSPIALLMLIPWTGVVAWVLMGRPDFRRISTTLFWDRSHAATHTRRGVHRPPLAYVLLLIAMLACILAAGGMAFESPQRATVTIIVDRNARTLAAVSHDTELRDRVLIEHSGPVDLIQAPGGEIERLDQGNVFSMFDDFRATAADTSGALDAMIRRELTRTDQPIRVVTTQVVNVTDPRISVIAPARPIANAAIESFAIVESPRPQAMVRVRNETAQSQATLRVDSAEQVIDLPQAGQEKDYFIDLPSVGEYAVATLEIEDDLRADNRAYLARTGAWPRVEARSALPASVGKLIGIYSAQRPASASAGVVALTTDPGASPGPSIAFAPSTTRAQGPVHIEPHPLTRDLDWARLLDGVRVTATRPPEGTPLVRVGDQPVLVETPQRSLWFGFDIDAIAQRAEFVILLTRAIDHVGGADQRYAAEPTRAPPPSWTRVAPSDPDSVDAAPGVFRTPDGLRALNIRPQTGSLAPLSAAPAPVGMHMIDLRPLLLLTVLLTGLWGLVRLTRS